MPYEVIVAIDPGSVSGAYAIRLSDGLIIVDDLPVVAGMINSAAFAATLGIHDVKAVIIESVGPMPKQGVSSVFNFGFACGQIHGTVAACGIPIHYITPTVWKRYFKLKGGDKEGSRALAIERHPNVAGLTLKKHHGRAEALLMLDHYVETKERKHVA